MPGLVKIWMRPKPGLSNSDAKGLELMRISRIELLGGNWPPLKPSRKICAPFGPAAGPAIAVKFGLQIVGIIGKGIHIGLRQNDGAGVLRRIHADSSVPSAVTSTCAADAAICRAISSGLAWPAVTATFYWVVVTNPGAVTRTEYWPEGTLTVYCPCPSVLPSRGLSCAGHMDGSIWDNAADGSVTVPLMVPIPCASAQIAEKANNAIEKPVFLIVMIRI